MLPPGKISCAFSKLQCPGRGTRASTLSLQMRESVARICCLMLLVNISKSNIRNKRWRLTSGADTEEPQKPELKILDVNLIGVMYTVKLARHYFMKHPLNIDHDRCLIFNSSMAGFMDMPGTLQYMASKWGCRGMMRCLRRTTTIDGVRANLIAPW
jgi:hypothetical protein